MAAPVSAPVRRLGIMGGTFDPIHLGHLIAASEALHVFGLDRIVFVPTGQPWQKERYSNSEDRYLMTVLGVAAHPCFAVSRIEIDRKGPTYTADTMRSLRDFHGDACEMFFIAGADAILKVGTWRKVEELAELGEMVAVTRPGFDLGSLQIESSWPKIHLMEMPAVDISASDIRSRVRAGRPIEFLVPQEVADYIRQHGLYMGEAER